ncbi:uncharacterized protein N0V89_003391 [Didymosphaeria variabile]|uniref:Uncharacterized protein n=1 Tax=Didymosphaeria variabile TaxID=1932322 RepID=A0A9W9CC70_9PLEO|nr:uncharacterized protein N0V89_003391 [Didymosphaeria variabile]KAJ4355375.1 hypothetical protein N0V89_003391 [Didymosphaeria variabile]
MAPQVSRSEFPWSSPVVIVKSGDVALTKEELADLVLGSLAADALGNDSTPVEKPTLNVKPTHPSRDLRKENAELKKALEQCRKREGAIQAVFIKNHEKEQELSAKERELDDKHSKLAIYEARLEVEKKDSSNYEFWADHTPAQADRKLKARVEYLERELARCLEREDAVLGALNENQKKEQQLAEKQLKLEKQEQCHICESKLLQITQDALEKQNRCIDMYIAEQNLVLESYRTGSAQSDAEVESESNRKWTATLQQPRSTILSCGDSKKLFDNESFAHLDEYDFELFNSTVMKSRDVELLRRHDYYKGWLDAKKAEDAEHAFNEGLLGERDAKYLWDIGDTRSASNAGHNVGASFGWSALCVELDEKDKDPRLDGRQWALADLVPLTGAQSKDFWEGVRAGSDYAAKNFMERKRSGNWYETVDGHEAIA